MNYRRPLVSTRFRSPRALNTHLRHLRLLLLFILQRILHILANRYRPDPVLEPLPAKHCPKHHFRILEPARGLDSAAALFLALLVVYGAQVGVGEDLEDCERCQDARSRYAPDTLY